MLIFYNNILKFYLFRVTWFVSREN